MILSWKQLNKKEGESVMKKLFKSLPFRLLLGVVVGMLVGLVANEAFMNVIVTVKYVMGQIITFCVPLIVIAVSSTGLTRRFTLISPSKSSLGLE